MISQSLTFEFGGITKILFDITKVKKVKTAIS